MNSKHGAIAFMRTGVIPKRKLHIARAVDAAISEMILDLGGEGEITASQKIIISTIRQNLVFLGLVNEWIARQPGIVNEKGEMLSPLNGFYLACQGAVTRNCRELGLKRVNPMQSLEGYLEAKAQAGAGEGTTKATSKRAGREKIVDPGARGEGGGK